jgi:TonB-dependent receptor
MHYSRFALALLATSAVVAVAAPAQAQVRSFNVAAQPAATGVPDFARQAGVQVLVAGEAVSGQRVAAVKGDIEVREALRRLLAGTDLTIASDDGRTITLVSRQVADAEHAVDQVLVIGQRLSEQRSIDHKHDADGVTDAISADEMGQMPDKNAAESVERLPGVGLKYDQGEGRYVSIRGVDGALNNVTLNGVELGSPDSNSRAIPLDVVSGQLTSRIEVIKAVTANMDAQAVGGTINLVTQSPFDVKGGQMLRASTQVGWQELNHKTPFAGEFNVGKVFGDTWGVLVGINYSDRDYRTYGLYPDDWREVPGATRGMPTNIKYTTYDLDRKRLGVNGSIEYRPSDQDRVYLRALYSSFKENEYRQRYRLDFATAAQVTGNLIKFTADGVGTSTGGERRQDLRLDHKDKSVLSTSVGGQHDRGGWDLDWDVSYGRNELRNPNGVWQFRGSPVTTSFDMSDLLYTAVAQAEIPASGMGFRQYTYQNSTGDETIWAGKLNLKRELAIGEGSYVQFGLKYRSSEKVQDVNITQYARASAAANRFTLADFGLQGAPTRSFIGNRVYENPVTISESIESWTAQNLNTAKFLIDNITTLSNNTLSDYDVQEQVAAGYGMAKLGFGKWSVLGGVRVERTATDAEGYQLLNGSSVQKQRSKSDYVDVLPNLHVRFDPSREVVVRLSVTQTIGRPQYPQLSPGGSFDVVESPIVPGTFSAGLSEGNVNLKPYKSTNLDFSAEWYFARGGQLSLGAFNKEIKNPIFNFGESFLDYRYGDRTYTTFGYSQPRNADKGSIHGVELSWRQQFNMLPGALGGLGIGANATFTGSDLKVPDRTDKLPFPKQSNTIYGGQLFYQKYGVQAVLGIHRTGAYLDTIGEDRAGDTYFNTYTRVDLKASYKINRHISVFVEGQNLNDEVLWEYQGKRPDWIIGYERYGATWYAGLSAKW